MDALVSYDSDGDSRNSSRNTPDKRLNNEPQEPNEAHTKPAGTSSSDTQPATTSQSQLDAEWDFFEKFLDETSAALAKANGEKEGEEAKSPTEDNTSTVNKDKDDTTDHTERRMSISSSSDSDGDDSADDRSRSKSVGSDRHSRSLSPPVLEQMETEKKSETDPEKTNEKTETHERSKSPHKKRSRSRSRKRSRSPHRKRRSRSRSRSRSRRHRNKDRRRRSRSPGRKRRKSSDRSRSKRSRSRSRHRRSRSRSRTRRKSPSRRDRKRKHRSRSPRRRRCSRSTERRKSPRRSPIRRKRSPPKAKPKTEFVDFKTRMRMELQRAAKEALEGKTVMSQSSSAAMQTQLNSIRNSILAAATSGEKLTPQQALVQSMAAMHQKAQELTGVAVPKYYNPAAVNPLKYAEQVNKRKLLWSKAKDNNEEHQTQWQSSAAMLNKDETGKAADKFRKLMGIKGSEGHDINETVVVNEETRKKQEELFHQLDREYEFARMTTHTHRGVGLGMLSATQPQPPK